MEHQKITERIVLCAEGVINAEFELSAECVINHFVGITRILHQLDQLGMNLLFKALCDELKLCIMLEHFTGDVERQILAVNKTLYKAEIIGKQIGTLVHDENTV